MSSKLPCLGYLVPWLGLEVGVAWGWFNFEGVEGSWANSFLRTFSSSVLCH